MASSILILQPKFYMNVLSLMYTTWPAHFILSDLITLRNCHWSFVFIFSKPNLVHSFKYILMVAL